MRHSHTWNIDPHSTSRRCFPAKIDTQFWQSHVAIASKYYALRQELNATSINLIFCKAEMSWDRGNSRAAPDTERIGRPPPYPAGNEDKPPAYSVRPPVVPQPVRHAPPTRYSQNTSSASAHMRKIPRQTRPRKRQCNCCYWFKWLFFCACVVAGGMYFSSHASISVLGSENVNISPNLCLMSGDPDPKMLCERTLICPKSSRDYM